MINITRIDFRRPRPPRRPDTHRSSNNLVAVAMVVIGDAFAVKSILMIESNGRRQVAMPNQPRRITCPQCNDATPVEHFFCHRCGNRLEGFDRTRDRTADVFVPLGPNSREWITNYLWNAYDEWVRSEESESAELIDED